MIDLDILRKRGLTPENLEKWLAAEAFLLTTPADPNTDEGKRHALLNRIRSRIQEGMDKNFREYKTYYAIDLAWETPFRQITPTLIQSFINQDPNQEDVFSAMNDWGLSNLIEELPDPKTPGKKVKRFNYPVFFNIMIPLVRSYVTIRWAKIMNDRLLTPFLKYEPVKNTTPLSLKCEALTDRVQVMSQQYGFYDVMKQSVLKMLQYSFCFQFPREEWDSEMQVKVADELDVAMGKKKPNGEPASVGDEILITAKEGLRYHHPHPTRTFRDLNFPAYAYNYDCGPEYAGYWQITRYKEVLKSNFWNKDKISLGSVDIMATNRLFFASVYAATSMAYPVKIVPTTPSATGLAAEIGAGAGPNDRESSLANQYYGVEHKDQGVLITHYFEKLVPKDNGLGDYDQPVWFRFVIGGDSGVVLYAAPLPYSPVVYYGYDADESRNQNASLALEVLPFQDQFSNLLTQTILTAKQNLANMTFVDTDQIDEPTKVKIQGMGEQTFRFLNVFGYSSKRAARMQNKIPEAVQSFNLPKGNVAELIAVTRNILEVLERVLVMSSQEVAQAASHELRADEVRNIFQSTSTRLLFTSTPVDIARDAWKRQIYQGLMAYGDDDIYMHIPSDTPLNQDQLEKMGFTFVDKDLMNPADQFRRARISKHRTAVPLWEFASTRDGMDRTDNKQIAVAMGQIIQSLINNPMTAQAIGPDQAIDLTNELCRLVGMRRDLKLRNVAPPQATEQEKQAQAQAQLKQVVDIIIPQVQKQLETDLKPMLDHQVKLDQEVNLIFRALNIPLPNNSNAPNIPAPAPEPGGNGVAPMAFRSGMPSIPAILA